MIMRSEIMCNWYLASLVERYHTWTTIRRETVAEHSHGVAIIYLRLFSPEEDTMQAMDTWKVLCYILEHDLTELWTGDLPFPVKKNYPALADEISIVENDAAEALGLVPFKLPTGVIKRRVKICDLLQMHLFGLHEMRLGNAYARPIAEDTLTAAYLLTAGDDEARNAVEKFKREHQ